MHDEEGSVELSTKSMLWRFFIMIAVLARGDSISRGYDDYCRRTAGSGVLHLGGAADRFNAENIRAQIHRLYRVRLGAAGLRGG